MPVYLNPLGDGRPIVIDKPILFVGRHPECDIILLNSRKVSRKHGCIAQVDSDFLVRDLGSTNGISVNGVRIDHESRVKFGDQVAFGDVQYSLLRGEIPEGAKIASRRDNIPDDAPLDLSDLKLKAVDEPVIDATELSQDFPVVIHEDFQDELIEPFPVARSEGDPPPQEIPAPQYFEEDSNADVMIIDESKEFFDDEDD